MIFKLLSNIWLDAALIIGVTESIYALVIRPRLHGRRTSNWVVRRVAKSSRRHPRATAITKNGPWLHRSVTATWNTVIGYEESSVAVSLLMEVSSSEPWHIELLLVQNEERHPVASFEWKWVSLRGRIRYPNLRAMKRELNRSVRLLLDHRARRPFPTVEEMVKWSNWGFLGLPIEAIVSD